MRSFLEIIVNKLQVTDRDPGPVPGPFFVIIIPVQVIFRNKPGLTGTIFTKVLFVQDCMYLL